jgi:hypothetical protein
VLRKALYGLRAAPRYWSTLRNKVLSEIKIPTKKGALAVEELKSEAGLWRIVEKEVSKTAEKRTKEGSKKDCENEKVTLRGWRITYVDDILTVARGGYGRKVLHETNKWKCSDMATLEEGGEMSFIGLQIARLKDSGGFLVHQENYVKSVLEKNGMKHANASKTTVDCEETQAETETKVKDREKNAKGKAENNKEVAQQEQKREVDLEMVRAAQKAVGELIWLVTRTKLDIAYTAHRDGDGDSG